MVDILLKKRYRELRIYFNNIKGEIKKYPFGSREYNELLDLLSGLSVELSFMRSQLRNQTLRLDYLNDLMGRLILGEKSSQLDRTSKII